MGAQADMMQARWGSHGHYEIIALAPCSAQEIFYQTITAFNLSERYRTPVLVMTDEIIGHMSEKVVIPQADAITTVSRPKPKGRKDRFKLYARIRTAWRPCRPPVTGIRSMSPD